VPPVADILRALAGRRWCPWCRMPVTLSWFDRNVIDRLPRRLVAVTLPYDRLIGWIGGGWHRAHHPGM
jgi:hypothetical protein